MFTTLYCNLHYMHQI